MKELGHAREILGMEISRDRVKKQLNLSQTSYVMKVLSKFNMENCKHVQSPFGKHFKLSSKNCLVVKKK